MRRVLSLAALAAIGLHCTVVHAQPYPSKPIRMIVGFPPGGGADTVARPIAEAMSRHLGQAIVVDNRPGAGTTLASATVARSAPDGYTILLGSAGIFGADQTLYRKSVTYTANDFTLVNRLTMSPLILAVSNGLGVSSVAELVAKAKAEPGKLNYASSGNGVTPHIAALYFEKLAGVDMQHVPYKGGAAAVQGIVTGETQLTFGTPPSVLPLAKSGRIKLLAVTTAERSPLFPELPTVAEGGVKGFDFGFWFGLYGPAGLPQEVVDRLFEASAKALQDPEVKAKLESSGNEAQSSKSPAAFREWAAAQGRKSRELTEQSGAQLD